MQTRRAAALKRSNVNDENAAPVVGKTGKELRSSKENEPTKAALGAKGATKRAALHTLNVVHNVQVQNNTTKVVKQKAVRAQAAAKKTLADHAVRSTKSAADNVLKSPKLEPIKQEVQEEPEPERIPIETQAKVIVKKEAKSTAVENVVEQKQRVAKSAVPSITSHLPFTAKTAECEDEQERTVETTVKVKDEADWDDLDASDALDPMMVSEYVVEIFDYMRELEVATMPNPNYMESQKELQWKMRAILVDWLVEVHHKFRLLPETLYMTVNIIDRFLSLRVVSLVKLQLVGVTAMFIASKYEEVVPPSVKNFIYMADNGYTDEEILKAERYVLAVLDFNLQYPSPMSFLRRCSKAEHYDIQTRTLAKYLMELSLIDHRFLDIAPSKIAGAGLYLARKMLRRGSWDKNLEHYSGYTEKELLTCVGLMLDYLERPIKYEALFKKYASKKFMRASVYVKDWMEKRRKISLGYGDDDGSDKDDYLL
ncbi:G2/mitotic-specific cyclin [Phlyctochytrium bullatum]|nr:G2/mitotic-specific cyclin [Phlyctochytrium bullatum]